MKSYLQRLISTASGAESQLQPVVGSVFSTADSRHEHIPSMIPNKEERAPQLVSTMGTLDQDSRMGEARSEHPMEDVEKLHTSAVSSSNFEPFLMAERFQFSETETTTPGLRPRAIAPLSLLAPTTASENEEQTCAMPLKSEVQVPLPNAKQLATALAADPQQHNWARLPRPTTNPPTARPAIPPVDEIQIHIGRIEVTAIPAPAKAPEQKPLYKGPSLQEYLKRHERSTR